jgi:uncharacterized protein (DUF2267 family)
LNYDEFVGQVQYHARLASGGDAVRAIRATLETLADRLSGGEADQLAAQLPREIGEYLRREALGDLYQGERFDLNQFYQRVAERERIPFLDAVFHARAVMQVLEQAVSPGEMDDVRAQLPKKYAPLFESWSSSNSPRGQDRGNERSAGASR